MKNFSLFLFLLLSFSPLYGQDKDSLIIRSIYDTELTSQTPVNNLKILCKEAPGRLAGSPNSHKASFLMEKILRSMKPDTVYLQEVETTPWERGKKEVAIVDSKKFGKLKLHALAIGGSINTGKKGLSAPIIEVQGLDELKKYGSEKIIGKIVFFNEPMDPKNISTVSAYRKAFRQRVWGAS